MAAQRPAATRHVPRPASGRSVRMRRRIEVSALGTASRQTTLVLVRWGLAAVCLYLLFEGEVNATVWPAGLVIVACLGASNVALSRQQREVVERVDLSVAIGIFDALLIAATWYVSGYESFTPVILSLCILNLALVGISLGEIAAVVLAFVILYSAIGQVD